ncbi:iron-containing alcohol dehydrogenase [Flammeovirga sp. EKP202]|uniref:iron-containing alcohol dehydrogenase n=1 Tax=Flammeovirga sp. EKP202 TaxID=2770592 RepID=UPI00165ECD00|nr:iron-containing alcohol dehydrogenase [Flammeovirga sp. EKP202]MBD0403486.1 iron-containing alcohol dehydrogenase [Flammeovirga sp. EKP202]
MLESRRIYLPPLSLVGPDSLKELVEELKGLPYKKALLVTDKALNELGMAKTIADMIVEAGLEYVIYDNVQPNPTTENVHTGLKKLQDEQCDVIISLGGGSPQDAAKAIGILATNGGNIADYEGVHISKLPSTPIVAINTTAGTASEVTINYVITDEKRNVKMVMVDKNCLVSIAVNDPKLMIGMPKSLTAATGLDALTHAIEAYITVGAFHWSDDLALYAIKLVSQSLVKAVENGQDLEARSKMAWAQFIAGQSFSNAGLGFVHSMAHQLGGQYDIPHGVANAVLLPHVMRYNAKVCAAKLKNVAEAMGVDVTGMTNEQGAEAAIDAITKMAERVNIPSGIGALGAKEEDIELMAENALKDICAPGNPREVTFEDAVELFKVAM